MAALEVESAGRDRRRLERSVVTLELFGRAGKLVRGGDLLVLQRVDAPMARVLDPGCGQVQAGEAGFGGAFSAVDQLEPRRIEGLGRLGRQESGQPLRVDIPRLCDPRSAWGRRKPACLRGKW